ncbi:MAG: hypothetical protein HS115_18145 [Spirochaetales bacterium]|nr:hypothetical protein [Spirochaetales bacterium]
MKRYLSILSLAAIFSLDALPEFTRAEEPTPEQVATMQTIVKEIAEVQQDISTYFKDLEERGLITQNQSSIPLTADVQTYYGDRNRYLLNEQGIINWQGEKIASFTFEQRRAVPRTGYIVKKRISANTVVDMNKQELVDLYVNEILTSGKGMTLNFRFAQPGEDLRDRTEVIDVGGGRKQQVQVVYVRNMNQKLSIAREYKRLLKLLLRRLDWMVRSEEARKAAQIERLMKVE